jgi:hypothetical protein
MWKNDRIRRIQSVDFLMQGLAELALFGLS